MTAVGLINAGTRLTASMLRGIAPNAAYKGADQSIASSTALANDSALFVPVVANAVYLFIMFLDYEGASGSGFGIKFGWTFPSGLTLRAAQLGFSSTGADLVATMIKESTVASAESQGAGTLDSVLLLGTIAVSSTAGTLQLQWAQNTSSATPTIVHASSALSLWQIQ